MRLNLLLYFFVLEGVLPFSHTGSINVLMLILGLKMVVIVPFLFVWLILRDKQLGGLALGIPCNKQGLCRANKMGNAEGQFRDAEWRADDAVVGR